VDRGADLDAFFGAKAGSQAEHFGTVALQRCGESRFGWKLRSERGLGFTPV
jgi:hypothetical protein